MRSRLFDNGCWVSLLAFSAAVLLLAARVVSSSEIDTQVPPAMASLDESATYLAEALGALDRHRGVQDIVSQIDHAAREQEKVLQDLKTLDGLISRINQQQLHAVIQKLSDIEAIELARREAESSAGATAGLSNSEASIDVSSEEMDALFEVHKILEESDNDIEGWILQVMGDETKKLFEPLQISNEGGPFNASIDASAKGSGITATLAEGNCTNSSFAAKEVQAAVNRYANDGIGVVDHAEGAAIVIERTSATYQPPVSDTLSSVWWSRYIPEDWERWLLPAGWQDWNARPNFLSHTVGSARHGGLLRGDVAPPSAILQASTLPGSCWPMAGSSGRVTLRLPYPVKVSAVSLDHVSRLLVTEEASLTSAPKTLRVYGYPACESDCAGLGFDVNRKVLLKEFQYDAQAGGVQTFAVASQAPANPSPSCDGAPAAMDDTADANSGSCTAPHPESVEPMVGIELAVRENLGNSDYTCLYRFRVHGEAVDTR
jgi:Sad1 / UNC-like C-terminal